MTGPLAIATDAPDPGSQARGPEETPAEIIAAKDALIGRFLTADSRERKKLLPRLRPHLTRVDVERIAPTLRDPSPRIAARVTSLLARHHLDGLFESLLVGLKPGKAQILRSHYAKIRRKS